MRPGARVVMITGPVRAFALRLIGAVAHRLQLHVIFSHHLHQAKLTRDFCPTKQMLCVS